jgi:hypothetical protein
MFFFLSYWLTIINKKTLSTRENLVAVHISDMLFVEEFMKVV